MEDSTRPRGRPFDPAVGEAALQATRSLLEERGYAGLRVADVARSAGIGLGALYRRWPDKHTLVLEALRGAVSHQEVPQTEDAMADLLAGLDALAQGLAERSKPLLAVVLSGSDPQLAAAVREAKLVPLRQGHHDRLRRVLGDVPDLDARADVGPALIILNLLLHGRPPSAQEIRERIVPLMLGEREPAGRGVED
ncbi:TetR family transcriptional regulator [Streptomyces sp. NPDC050788]|jgi:AcrR family transcriptional regulator|uniref:TetR/AcrR family transcriptional regulator n=1 Tax=Streptomyces sp. NPDC050788 TaxID=3155041 RepID=UPI00344984EF